ncbi:hypothetical protein [Austwickia sp. TVS 96-490-7B]|uniref:hypothetical protein n=1 Tax=Austwickia sp. TVS 96-490-7B TaxID=2830843 RepID=UPI001C595767|nr:hypothetical protein [Austwickia sp. TVS 96-490-7B]
MSKTEEVEPEVDLNKVDKQLKRLLKYTIVYALFTLVIALVYTFIVAFFTALWKSSSVVDIWWGSVIVGPAVNGPQPAEAALTLATLAVALLFSAVINGRPKVNYNHCHSDRFAGSIFLDEGLSAASFLLGAVEWLLFRIPNPEVDPRVMNSLIPALAALLCAFLSVLMERSHEAHILEPIKNKAMMQNLHNGEILYKKKLSVRREMSRKSTSLFAWWMKFLLKNSGSSI